MIVGQCRNRVESQRCAILLIQLRAACVKVECDRLLLARFECTNQRRCLYPWIDVGQGVGKDARRRLLQNTDQREFAVDQSRGAVNTDEVVFTRRE